ncbi:MAG: hypothetical protein HY828_18795 [Actinobacteria bacterium]|nr:hypothetical protein [Actinomycetota bacterium]
MNSKYTPIESLILGGLGGQPWGTADRKRADLQAALMAWSDIRKAAGFAGDGGWVTTDKTNVKLGKAGLPTVGVTLHASTDAHRMWKSITPAQRDALAAAVGRTVDEVDGLLSVSVCPRSTCGCCAGCVVSYSNNALMTRSRLARLCRNLLTVAMPAYALTLTAHQLELLTSAYGDENTRWRVNISDDIRWELVAPGLWDVAPKAYSYTKFSPAERPEQENLRLVYSASEVWGSADITRVTKKGHRVAVVFDCKKGALPSTWSNVPVVNGDITDDLWAHPAGSIVGLAVKGPTLAVRQAAAQCGFALPVQTIVRVSRRTIAA